MEPQRVCPKVKSNNEGYQANLKELSSMKSSSLEVAINQIKSCKEHLEQINSLLQQLKVEKEIFNQKKTGLLQELQSVESQESKHIRRMHDLQVGMVNGENLMMRLVRMKHCIESATSAEEVSLASRDSGPLYQALQNWSNILTSPRYQKTNKPRATDEIPENLAAAPQQPTDCLPIVNYCAQASSLSSTSLKKWRAMVNGGPHRAWHAAAAVGSKIYVFGGECTINDSCQTSQLDVHIFDSNTYAWSTVDTFHNSDAAPFRRWGHSAVAYGKNIYVWGGRNEENSCNILYCFDTLTNSWTAPEVHGPSPSARWKHSACVIKDCMYIFSGSSDTQDLHSFDFTTMTWNSVQCSGEPPLARVYHTAVNIGDIMYVWGGRKPRSPTSESFGTTVYAFNSKTRNWSSIDSTGSTPIARRSHSAFACDNQMYIFGGWDINQNKTLNDLWSFNPCTGEWLKEQQSIPGPDSMEGHVSAMVETRMFLHGGGDRESRKKDEVYNQAMWILDLQ